MTAKAERRVMPQIVELGRDGITYQEPTLVTPPFCCSESPDLWYLVVEAPGNQYNTNTSFSSLVG